MACNTGSHPIIADGLLVFQSLAGFFVACNKMLSGMVANMQEMFQSLAGFFVACNAKRASTSSSSNRCFNPWRVFSWLATQAHQNRERPGDVSIPGGFFRGLQRHRGRGKRSPGRWVSIPGGFFRGLQRKAFGLRPSDLILFQSLAGFFVACNQPDPRY